jgi:hypothetical protein
MSNESPWSSTPPAWEGAFWWRNTTSPLTERPVLVCTRWLAPDGGPRKLAAAQWSGALELVSGMGGEWVAVKSP